MANAKHTLEHYSPQRVRNSYILEMFYCLALNWRCKLMPQCSLFEVYKTPSGSVYYICHRPPFGEEGTMLPNGELQCQKCDKRK